MAELYDITVEDVEIPGVVGHGPGDSELVGSTGLAGLLVVPVASEGGISQWPAVVMVHEAFGLTDVMRRQAERLARRGFVVLMPDLFTMGGARSCLRATFRALLSGQGRAFVDIERSREWLVSRDDGTGRVGILGFCMGGGFALLAASRGFNASSVNYGMLPKDLDAALGGACPIVASYGGQDGSMRGAAAKLEAATTRADIPHDVKEYPTAGHSFLNDAPSGPKILQPLFSRVLGVGPDPVAAADAWARIEGFFDEHLRSAIRPS